MQDNNGLDYSSVHCRFLQTFVTAAFFPQEAFWLCLSSFHPHRETEDSQKQQQESLKFHVVPVSQTHHT